MSISAKLFVLSLAVALPLLAAQQRCLAGSATWAAQPTSSDWNTAQNWRPQTVPNAVTDTATFRVSTITDVMLSAAVDLESLIFSKGANTFTVTAEPATNLILSGTGIENASGVAQNFVCQINGGFSGAFFFFGTAAAGENTVFTVAGSLVSFNDSSSADHATFMVTNDPGISGGDVIFSDTSSAANATFIVPTGGNVNFVGSNTAENAQFTVTGGMYGSGSVGFTSDSTAANAVVNCSEGGNVDFQGVATADHAQITLNGAPSRAVTGGSMTLSDAATAGQANVVVNGGTAPGARGAVIFLHEEATMGEARITVNGGVAGGLGGSVFFYNRSDGGTARFTLFNDGNLDISKHLGGPVSVGSIAGNGQVFLGSAALAVGSNNASTTFFGVIQDGGRNGGTGGTLSKIGAGTLTLSGANTYTGGTTLTSGTLLAGNRRGSAAGTGSVAVNGGTLGGGGTISGAVTVGTGSGSGATLQPSFGAKKKVALTLQSLLSLKSDSTYSYRLKSRNAEVIANGVTIEAGAQFVLTAPDTKLPAGKSATVISNTAATPISGAFANLPDGGTIIAGGNTFQASYTGGDGNDLTLTVQ